jgi:hypothetical protein
MVKPKVRRIQATVRTPRQGEARKSMDRFKQLLRTMVKKARAKR